MATDNVSVINTLNNSVIKNIDVGDAPIAVAINPNNNKVYVSKETGHNVSVIDGTTDSVIKTIETDGKAEGIDINTTTNKIYVANLNNTIVVIDGVTDSIIKVIGGNNPHDVRVNSKTNKIYATTSNGGNVLIIDGSTDSLIKTINIGGYPWGIGINSKINRIYVASTDTTVFVIDGDIDSVIQTVKVGLGAYFIAVNDSTGKIYVTCMADGAVWVLVDKTAVEESSSFVETDYNLTISQNPFRTNTTIFYHLPFTVSDLRISIHDIAGRIVKTLLNEQKPAGTYTVNLNAKGLVTGVYFVKMVTDNYQQTKKLILMK